MNHSAPVTIKRIQHVGIPVTDISVSEAFYIRLGFEKVMHSGFKINSATGTCIMMKSNEIVLELYLMPEPQLAEIKARKNGHIDHIAFDVDDIDSAFLTLKKASFVIIEEEPVFLSFWTKGCKYFNILGPDGERIEFNQIIK